MTKSRSPSVLIPGPVEAPVDLRTMLRNHLARRGLECIARGAQERAQATRSTDACSAWSAGVRETVRQILDLDGYLDAPLNVRAISRLERPHHVLENVIFESVEGWQVNASVFIPRDEMYAPPYPGVVVPCGHSPKSDGPHQLPCQVFARAGFVAVTFDPPAQGGEKCPGNDHFRDGPRCYAVGQTSQRYFIADALRAIDYLASRDDVDASLGFAVTGVSGGGETTRWTALMDDRVRLAAPVCSAARLADHPIADQYAWCPECLPIGRLAAGLDDVDLMAALAPLPQLYMAGQNDSVYLPELSERLAAEVRAAYEAAGAADEFGFFLQEDCGHDYTPEMARRFVGFAEKHWLAEPERAHSKAFDEVPPLEPAEAMFCRPDAEPNTRTLAAARAVSLRRSRPKLASRAEAGDAVRAIVEGIDQARIDRVERGNRRQIFRVRHEEVLLGREQDVYLPATALWPLESEPAPAVILFDDRGRWQPLQFGGWLASVARVCAIGELPSPAVLSVDLRGWGDTTPTAVPYDLAPWSGADRLPSYLAASLGPGLLGMRVADAVASCRWLARQPEVDAGQMILAGHGLGGIVALMTAAIVDGVAGVICLDTPQSIEQIVAEDNQAWPLEIFQPDILKQFDIAELAEPVGPTRFVRPRDATGKALNDEDDGAATRWVLERLGM